MEAELFHAERGTGGQMDRQDKTNIRLSHFAHAPKNVICEENVELLNAKPVGTQSNHCALKS